MEFNREVRMNSSRLRRVQLDMAIWVDIPGIIGGDRYRLRYSLLDVSLRRGSRINGRTAQGIAIGDELLCIRIEVIIGH